MRSSPILDIQVAFARWQSVPNLRPRLREAAAMVLGQLPKRLRFPAEATLLLTSDAQLRQLNRDFRGVDKATNVLSFPQFLPDDLKSIAKLGQPMQLGDLALAYQYVVAEARRDHKILLDHTTHLVVHGLLHLFGYDHDGNDDAETMERLETKIMKAMGLTDPYIERPTQDATPKGNRSKS